LVVLVGVGNGFVFPLGLGMLAFGCDSPALRPFDENGGGPFAGGAVGFAIAPGVCTACDCGNAPEKVSKCYI
jgi:hypothetical protein